MPEDESLELELETLQQHICCYREAEIQDLLRRDRERAWKQGHRAGLHDGKGGGQGNAYWEPAVCPYTKET